MPVCPGRSFAGVPLLLLDASVSSCPQGSAQCLPPSSGSAFCHPLLGCTPLQPFTLLFPREKLNALMPFRALGESLASAPRGVRAEPPTGAAALGLTVYLVNLLSAEQTALTHPTMYAPQTDYLWGTPKNTWLADGLSLTFCAGREEQASKSPVRGCCK